MKTMRKRSAVFSPEWEKTADLFSFSDMSRERGMRKNMNPCRIICVMSIVTG